MDEGFRSLAIPAGGRAGGIGPRERGKPLQIVAIGKKGKFSCPRLHFLNQKPSGGMSTELTEDGGAPNASLRQLPAPGTIAGTDLAARLAEADAAISTSGAPRRSQDQPRRAAPDLGRPQAGSRRVAWAGRAAHRKAVVAPPRRRKSRRRRPPEMLRIEVQHDRDEKTHEQGVGAVARDDPSEPGATGAREPEVDGVVC
jgi:hypothetical protein